MPTETMARDVLEDVREACEKTGRPTTAAEVDRALDGLSAADVDAVRRLARGRLEAAPLGPDALVDIARGIPAPVAAARELGGYYAMKAERDALARLAGRPESPEPDAEEPGEPAPPPDALAGEKQRLRPPMNPKDKGPESEALMTLFAYHRDAVLVAQAMNIGLQELNDRVESMGLRRRINRMLETTTDIDVFSPDRLKLPKGTAQQAPMLRKKGEKPAAPPPLASAPSFEARRDPPAASTEPVNEHGTRVYRRAEAPPETPATSGANGRREYVRETRKKPKLVPPRREEKPAPPPAPAKRPFSELQGPAGKGVLERLLADEKANPRVLAGKLGERYEGPGRELSEGDLRALLGHHGLAAMFAEREVVNTRFLIGFHQGARAKLANALQMTAPEVSAYLTKLGLSDELEHTRAERSRLELGRKRIADRLVQVLTRAPYLDDLGVLGVIDREVREHIEGLFAAREPRGGPAAAIAEEVRAELGVEPNAFAKLLKRYDMSGKLGA